MKYIKANVENEYKNIKAKTLHDTFLISMVIIFIVYVPGALLSAYEMNYKIKMALIATIVVVSSIAILEWMSKKMKCGQMSLNWYLGIAIVFAVVTSVTSPGKYMTTMGVAMTVYTIIIFFSLSKRLLLLQGVLTLGIFLYFSIVGINQEIVLGAGYPVVTFGTYTLLLLVLYRGIKMYEQFEKVYLEKIEEIHETNIELRALNEEYLASEETLRAQYDEINELSIKHSNLNSFLSSIIRVTEDGFMTLNKTTDEVTFYSGFEAYFDMYDFKLHEDLPKVMSAIHEEDRNRFIKAWLNVYKDVRQFEQIDVRYSYNDKPMDLRIAMMNVVLKNDDATMLLAVKDITMLKDTERELLFHLDHDHMTGALNWKGIINDLKRLIVQERFYEFYVVVFDLDDFMYINSSFGYNMGDQIIEKLSDSIKANQELFQNFARTEGDKFIFLVKKSIPKKSMLEKLYHILSSIEINGVKYQLQASIGIADAHPEVGVVELLRNAEMAMHKVKQSGKGTYALHDDIYIQKMNRQFKLFSIMNEAMLADEFYLLFQPKVDTFTERVVGFEALVRWESGEIGRVFPDEFIELAEQTGQIIELGWVIIRKSLEFVKRATLIDPNVVVSINLSPKQLLQHDFLVKAQAYILEAGVKLSNIAFEITETAYIENLENVKKVLEQIDAIGIEIYLDDFGTGYSSLGYLSALPIRVLKIDKSFVDTIHHSDHAKNLLKSIIAMAKTLDLDIVAEGVEGPEQHNILKDNGCDFIQGYYFDKPLVVEEAIQRLEVQEKG